MLQGRINGWGQGVIRSEGTLVRERNYRCQNHREEETSRFGNWLRTRVARRRRKRKRGTELVLRVRKTHRSKSKYALQARGRATVHANQWRSQSWTMWCGTISTLLVVT